MVHAPLFWFAAAKHRGVSLVFQRMRVMRTLDDMKPTLGLKKRPGNA
jgi:hypothetical protein